MLLLHVGFLWVTRVQIPLGVPPHRNPQKPYLTWGFMMVDEVSDPWLVTRKGPPKGKRQITNQGFVDNYIAYCEGRNRQPTTLAAYRNVLELWATWCNKQDMRSMKRKDMADFVQRPRGGRAQGKPGAPASQARDTAILKGFYQWMQDEGFTDRNLSRNLHAPTVHNKNPRPAPEKD